MYLTIGIPTYNRFNRLSRTLSELKNQIEVVGDKNIEVIVSDNCSPDQTLDLLKKYSNNEWFSFQRHDQNKGFDNNVNSIFKVAKGKFTWILSDDDFIHPNCLGDIVSNLYDFPKINFAFLNYSIQINNDEFPAVIKNNRESNETIGFSDFLKNYGVAYSFISSCIFSTKVWNKYMKDEFIGTGWVHMEVIKAALPNQNLLLINNKGITMIQTPIIHGKFTISKSGIEYFIDTHLNLIQYVEDLKGKIENTSYHKLYNQILDGDVNQILNFKLRKSKYSFTEIGIIIKRFWYYRFASFSFYFVIVPLTVLPPVFFRTFYKLKKINVLKN